MKTVIVRQGITAVLALVVALVAAPLSPIAATAGATPRLAYARSAPAVADGLEIYTMATDGSDRVRLTRNAVDDTMPAISPDGTSIAFVRDRAGTSHLYVMDAAGGNVRRLTAGPDGDSLPAWSPDGEWIVFTRTYIGQNQADLFKVRSSGGQPVRLTSTPEIEYAPEWSPDGSLIAYARVGARQRRFGIGVMRADGSYRRWITQNPRSDRAFADLNPTWSPTGHRLAFSRETADHSFDLFSVRLDGTRLRRLTRLRADAGSPTWSRDGRIAFVLRGGIAVMNRDGLDLHLIARAQRDAATPRPYDWPDW